MATRTKLVEELLKLPSVDRAEAARALLESLGPSEDPERIEHEWRRAIADRVEEVEDERVTLLDGPQAMQDLRDRARKRLGKRGQ